MFEPAQYYTPQNTQGTSYVHPSLTPVQEYTLLVQQQIALQPILQPVLREATTPQQYSGTDLSVAFGAGVVLTTMIFKRSTAYGIAKTIIGIVKDLRCTPSTESKIKHTLIPRAKTGRYSLRNLEELLGQDLTDKNN